MLWSTIVVKDLSEVVCSAIQYSKLATTRRKYCVAAHSGALKAIGVSAEEITRIETDLDQADFTGKGRALIHFARKANRAANDVSDEEFLAVRDKGARDAEIIEALGVMEVFTAFNKFLDALDVELG